MSCEVSIKQMIADLYGGGWEPVKGFNGTLWQSLTGAIYRGPHKAWHVWAGTPMCDPNSKDEKK
jgi:hypothetical protein